MLGSTLFDNGEQRTADGGGFLTVAASPLLRVLGDVWTLITDSSLLAVPSEALLPVKIDDCFLESGISTADSISIFGFLVLYFG